ncbi:hypothetical protein DENSPDRAFT_159733 [Dentipellis sp. KUC8613]|nr:hypothetical protein DENSPDRAFT_159733 [Dentipellis sp. KUC8613]
MPAIANVRATLGAILLGCMLSVALSGIVAAQTFLYYKLYPKDLVRIKVMVFFVWLLDAIHACLISSATWDYVILNWGDGDIADVINTSVALTVACTALVTVVVHLFFCHRVFRLSKNNYWITVPLVIFAILRLGPYLAFALVTTASMTRLRSFSAFVDQFSWCFTMGLALSSVLDILIAASLVYLLQASRTGFASSVDHVINTIMIHTFNNGALTCVTTIVSMIMWLVMPNNLIFLGLHFAITKLYANSLLATLNTRKGLRGRSAQSGSDHPMPVLFPSSFRRATGRGQEVSADQTGTKLQINVEKTVQYAIDGPSDHTNSTHSP